MIAISFGFCYAKKKKLISLQRISFSRRILDHSNLEGTFS